MIFPLIRNEVVWREVISREGISIEKISNEVISIEVIKVPETYLGIDVQFGSVIDEILLLLFSNQP